MQVQTALRRRAFFLRPVSDVVKKSADFPTTVHCYFEYQEAAQGNWRPYLSSRSRNAFRAAETSA